MVTPKTCSSNGICFDYFESKLTDAMKLSMRPKRLQPKPAGERSNRRSGSARCHWVGLISCSKRSGQADPYGRAAVYHAFNGEIAFVSLDDVLDDRQAQTGAAEVARARLVDSIKTLGQARQVFFRNSGARVDHGDFDLCGAAVARRKRARVQSNFTAARRVFERIIDQVDEQLL